jgi:exopolyphosphatase/guanosine-5'-triphosphate,3'-diphosphate pyrophosphatase
VVDLGSNSVRLVVYEGLSRNPVAVFNEKAVLRLGRGLEATGRLNEEGTVLALAVLQRYHAVARAMGASTMEVLATAAVRDARNGPEFVSALQHRLPGVPISILSGQEEASYSAAGVLCGIPDADGMLADIGGGSLELVCIDEGAAGSARTLGLGVIRLAERAEGDLARARAIVESDLATIPWMKSVSGRDLYLVGGAWRALARIRMAQTNYPLTMVHHFAMTRDAARDFAAYMATASRRTLDRLPAVPRRRAEDLPFAALVLRRLLRVAMPSRVVFSASGMREGWYMRRIPEDVRRHDPLLAAGRDYALRLGRNSEIPPALAAWIEPLLPSENQAARRLRETACWMSDVGSRDHPEFRAEQAFWRVFRQPGIGLDHHARAFLALAVAVRYEAPDTAPYLEPARRLLDPESAKRAEIIGAALRLAYTLSAGTPDLLGATSIAISGGRLVLRLVEASGVFAGDGIQRRLDRLGLILGLETGIETVRAAVAA